MFSKTFFQKNSAKLTVYLIAGILFGFGLALSGMTDPKVVIGFLDITGSWNISLIFVMIGGITVTSLGYRIIFTKKTPIFEKEFFVPTNKSVDKSLILGAVLFGSGWGLYGFCPGPALASLASFNPQTIAFVLAMAVGMFIANKFSPLLSE